MARPIRSELDPSGAYRVTFDDGMTSLLPPTQATDEMHAQLGSPLEGAVASTSLQSAAQAALASQQPAPVPVGGISTVETADMSRLRAPGQAAQVEQGKTWLDRIVSPDPPPAPQDDRPWGPPASPTQPQRPRYAPATRIPGGPMTTGWQEHYTRHDPRVEGHLEAAQDSRDMAGQVGLMAAQQRNQTEALYQEQENRIREKQQQEIEQQRQKNLELQRAAQDDIYRTQQRVAEMEVTPDKWWSDKSALQQIGLVMATMIGTLGGQDKVAGMVERAISADIDAQKAKISQSNKALEDQKSLYAQMLAMHGNEEDATLATHAAFERMVARSFEQRANRISDPEFAAQSMQLAAERDERAAELYDRLYSRKVSESIANVPDRIVGGGPARGGADPLANLSKEQRAQYLEAAKDLGKYAVARDAVERSAATMETTGGAGFGLSGLVSRVPVVGGYLIGSEGRDNQSHFDSAAQLTADAVGISEKGQQRYLDAVTSSATKGDAQGGVEMMRRNLGSASQTILNRVDPEVRRLLIQHNPNLFAPTVPGRKPGEK